MTDKPKDKAPAEEATADEAEPMDPEVFSNTGLQADSTTIVMQDNSIYLVLTKEDMAEGDEDAATMDQLGLAMLSKAGGHEDLVPFAYGIFELLHTDPEMILAAGYEFLTRKAGFQEGTNTLN